MKCLGYSTREKNFSSSFYWAVSKQTFEREDGKQMLKEWGIEGDYEGIGFCILGYAAKEGKTAPRKANRIFYVK